MFWENVEEYVYFAKMHKAQYLITLDSSFSAGEIKKIVSMNT